MNSNAKFDGFTPEELAAEPQTPKEDPIDPKVLAVAESLNKVNVDWLKKTLENEDVKKALAEQGLEVNKEALDKLGVGFKSSVGFKSPDSGQPDKPKKTKKWSALKHKSKKTLSGIIEEAKKLPDLQQIYYDKSLTENLKASSGLESALQGGWTDTIKADDLDKAYAEPLEPLSVETIKKAKASFQAQQALINQKLDTYNTYIMGKDAVFTTPSTVTMPSGPQWFTYNYPFEDQYTKEIQYLKTQLTEAKEIIKQLSGEPGEFIYIHPFDLYELLNSFVIPVIMNVNEEISDKGYIEINGKKYKQSTLMPDKSGKMKEEVAKLKASKPDWSNCDVCNGTKTGHLCDKHLPNPNNEHDWSKAESVTIKEKMPMSEFEKKYPW